MASKFIQTYDSLGNVNGGRYEDDNGMTTGYQQITAPKPAAQPFKSGFFYNNQQVSEDEYRRMTGTGSSMSNYQAPAVPSSIANTGAGPMAQMVSQLSADQLKNMTALRARITDAANPYGLDTQGYRSTLNNARNRLGYQTIHNQALNEGRVGGPASGLRAAASDAASRDARAAYAGIESQMAGAERDRAAQYENNRDAALMTLGAGDYSGAAGMMAGLLNTSINQYNADRDYGLNKNQDARAEATTQAQLKRYALDFNMDEQTFQSALAAKKAEYEAAAAQGQQAAWEANNAKWLGPLKAIVNIGVGVAKAYAGGGI